MTIRKKSSRCCQRRGGDDIPRVKEQVKRCIALKNNYLNMTLRLKAMHARTLQMRQRGGNDRTLDEWKQLLNVCRNKLDQVKREYNIELSRGQ